MDPKKKRKVHRSTQRVSDTKPFSHHSVKSVDRVQQPLTSLPSDGPKPSVGVCVSCAGRWGGGS